MTRGRRATGRSTSASRFRGRGRSWSRGRPARSRRRACSPWPARRRWCASRPAARASRRARWSRRSSSRFPELVCLCLKGNRRSLGEPAGYNLGLQPMSKPFLLRAPFEPSGDQPKAIEQVVGGIREGLKEQVLMGVTGSGKTNVMSLAIEQLGRPVLILSPNKTLAAQLWAEFRRLFPENAVEYFVSYYDYYQPEAYIARSDTYIEKDSSRNEEIDRLRHATTQALLTRRDVIVVASVSCIYGIGSPEDYMGESLEISRGSTLRREMFLRKLTELQYERNDYDLARLRFRVRGDVVDLVPAYEEKVFRVEFFGDEIERILELDGTTGEIMVRR